MVARGEIAADAPDENKAPDQENEYKQKGDHQEHRRGLHKRRLLTGARLMGWLRRNRRR